MVIGKINAARIFIKNYGNSIERDNPKEKVAYEKLKEFDTNKDGKIPLVDVGIEAMAALGLEGFRDAFARADETQQLINQLASPDQGERDAAKTGLIALGKNAAGILLLMLDDERQAVRCGCAEVLGEIGAADPKTVAALANTSKNDPDPSVRVFCLISLGKLGQAALGLAKDAEGNDEVVKVLYASLQDSKPGPVVAAIEAMAMTGDPQFIPEIIYRSDHAQGPNAGYIRKACQDNLSLAISNSWKNQPQETKKIVSPYLKRHGAPVVDKYGQYAKNAQGREIDPGVSSETFASIIDGLEKVGGREAIPDFMAMLDSRDLGTVATAAQVLSKLGKGDKEVLAKLASRYRTVVCQPADLSAKTEIILAIGQAGQGSDQAFHFFKAELGKINSSWDSFGLQTELLVGLAELGDVRAIPILQRFLTGTFVENTRRAAAEGLGKIEDNRAVNILLAQYDAEESYGVQGAIKEALKSSPLAEEVADAIAARLIRIPRGILPDSEDFPGALFYVLYDLADTSKVDTTYAVGLFDKIESDSSNQEVKDRAKKLGERLKNELAKKT